MFLYAWKLVLQAQYSLAFHSWLVSMEKPILGNQLSGLYSRSVSHKGGLPWQAPLYIYIFVSNTWYFVYSPEALLLDADEAFAS